MAIKNSNFNPYLIILLIFLFIRPISLLYYGKGDEGLSAAEIFAISSTYLLILAVFLRIRYLRFDLLTILIIGFISYSLLSILWGSFIRDVARLIMPFFVFFATRALVKNSRDIKECLTFLILGYIYPILNSSWLIIRGQGMDEVGYYSGLIRFRGSMNGSHTLGHSLTVFIFVCTLFVNKIGDKKTMQKMGLMILSLLALFCVYKSYTRTVYAGLLIFSCIYLWHVNKKILFAILLILCTFSIYQMDSVRQIIVQVQDTRMRPTSVDHAASGRLSLWQHNLKIFIDTPLERKLIGNGVGSETKPTLVEARSKLASSHNDYISLLITLGIIGLVIYLCILAILVRDIFSSAIDKRRKWFFMAFITSIIIMNALSNSYISRFELAQFFWFIIGVFYTMKERLTYSENKLYTKSEHVACQ